MDRNSITWEGNLLPIVTPFKEDESLDEQALADAVDLGLANGSDGIIVAGCTGEWWTLTDDERVRVFEIVVKQTAGRIPVIAGTSAVSTANVITLTQAAKDVGCDGAMVTAPPYALPLEREIVTHFERISEAVAFPIMLYNNPRRLHRWLTPELVDRLADVNTVVAIKDSSGDFEMQKKTLAICSDRIRYFDGIKNGEYFVANGASGFTDSTIPQLLGDQASRYYWLLKDGKIDEARAAIDLQQWQELHDLTWGEAGMFPAALKEAMNMIGRPGGFPRDPLLPLNEQEKEVMRTRLGELGVQPLATVS